MQEIKLTKDSYDVTIYASKVVEKLKNRIFAFTPGKASKKWSEGKNDSILVNLLRITHDLNINIGYICASSTKNAKEVKEDLKDLFNGGFAAGAITFTYDGDSYEGFIEDLMITENARDFQSDSAYPNDSARYEVQLNFFVGNPAI